MWSYSQLLSLPSSLLLVVLSTSPIPLSIGARASTSSESQWPYNLPKGMKYFPEDEVLVKRGLIAHQKLSTERQRPNGMRRMSPDPDEMFFLDYWTFDNEDYAPTLEQAYFVSNSSSDVFPPLLAHSISPHPQWHGGFAALRFSNLAKRDFTCPNGYSSCSSIGRQYSCCASGNSCVLVPDTGLGDVGCCPPGASCGGSMGSCDGNAGYKSCPKNGGCCLPGFDCFDVGCISTTTSTTTTTLAAATATSCTSGFSSCAASLGGGCCPNSLTCGSSNSCFGASTSTSTVTQPTQTTSAAAIVPIRPTDSDTNVATPSIVTTGTQLLAICPTNFYFCSAYYRPGCCRIGRDCAMTNCPAATSSSTLVSNGVTVVIPVGGSTGGQTYQSAAIITGTGAVQTFGTGACVSGWLSCAQSVGGGCCPGGYACGALCTGAETGGVSGSVVAKRPPSAASGKYVSVCGWMVVIFGSGFGAAMVLL